MIGKLNVKPLEKFRFESWVRPKKAGDAREPEPVERALREMLERFEGRRLALIVNLKDPHRPFPESHEELDAGAPAPHDPARLSLPPSFHDTPEARGELARYYDVIGRLDRTVGRLLAVLDERGLAQDSLVVFTSDNGQPFPFAKTTLYEAGINLPFLARWPGVVDPGASSRAFVSLIDLLPTALETFGVAAPPLDGRSLLPLLRGEVEGLREIVVGEHNEHLVGRPTPSRSLRLERFKYIRNFETGEDFQSNVLDHSATWRSWVRAARSDQRLRARMQRLVRRPEEELYDLERDPYELADLAGDPAQAATLADLRARLSAWMRDGRDPLYAG
jgi:N-sulfoglucosamine sulfohydrolase